MDPIVVAAGTALVGAMATDAWQQTRAKVVEWWRAVSPDQAESIGLELAEAGTQVVAARRVDDATAEREVVSDWQARLQLLLRANPEVANDLRRLLDEDLTPTLPEKEQSHLASIVMRASASGRGRVYQAGRDQTITER
ncbi:hypothetical protein [Streptomyces chryseus]|uniref:hypothetical protein n=1 Tax=Streptomyces chryseus TaxID=68186 RepID=UPI00110F7C57|nr:hypothetical protein [Streptomyces chryseus]